MSHAAPARKRAGNACRVATAVGARFTCPVHVLRRPVAVLTLLALALTGCAVTQPSADPMPTASASVPPPSAAPPGTPDEPSSTPSVTRPPTTAPAGSKPVDCTEVKCVALTFDDGPGPQTGELLDILVEQRVPATFFLVGYSVRTYPKLARRIAETDGMIVANHTSNHPMLTRIGAAEARREIVANSRLIARVTGRQPRYFRPPYGMHNARTDAAARSVGQPVVLWGGGLLDWQYRSAAKIVEVTMPQVRPGAVLLAHDVHRWTIDAVPTLIRRIRAKGYVLVGLPDILGRTRPGKVYWQGRS